MSAGETLLQDDGDPESMQMAGEVNDDGGYLEVGDELDGGYDAPRRKATWQTTSATVVSNMLGVGVLGLPYAFGLMGWWLALVVMAIAALLSVYSTLIIGWLRGSFTSLRSYADVAAHATFGYGDGVSHFFRRLVQGILYSLLLGICTVYLITMKLSLEQILRKCDEEEGSSGDSPWPGFNANSTLPGDFVCDTVSCSAHGLVRLPDSVWLFLTAAILFPFMHFRSLSQAPWLMYTGVGTILIVNIIILIRAFDFSSSHYHKTVTYHTNLTLRNIVNGVTIIFFSFGGHAVMVDILADMRDTRLFPKAIYWAQSIMVLNYAAIGFAGYYAFGDRALAPITLNLPRDGVTTFANLCLLIHVAVGYCINSTVLVRNCFEAAWPGSLYSVGHAKTKTLRWGFLSTIVLLLCFCIAVVVPFFSDIMNIISAYGIFSLSVWVPALLLLLSQSGRVSMTLSAANIMIVVLGFAGLGLGMWAAVGDAVDQFQHCDYHFARN